MGLNCGIVGLPNVGKSTLFNALTQSTLAEVANYPFCTIEPNTGKTIVRDARLKSLAEIANSEKTIYSQVEFVDIAGLVQGASTGEGLGNKFLGHIREVDAIMHVLRCFEDGDIRHVNSTINPMHDAEIVEMELMLADMESVKRRLSSMAKAANSDKDIKRKKESLEKVLAALENGQAARNVTDIDQQELRQLQLITSKPVMYVCNVEETSVHTGNSLSNAVKKMAEASGNKCCCLSAKLEAEIANLEDEEMRDAFLREVGLTESGIDAAVRVMYCLLDLITFFTVGPKEARAWSITKDTRADKAAGAIHTDFERGFIKAETISFADYVQYAGIAECKKAGRVRFEGRDYIVQDGDVIHFRVNK